MFRFFRFSENLTTWAPSSGLSCTRSAPALLTQDKAAKAGQFCAHILWLQGTPWELRPPKMLNFNAKVRIWRKLVTAGIGLSGLLSSIVVDKLADSRCAEYELPTSIAASTAGTQTSLPMQYCQFCR